MTLDAIKDSGCIIIRKDGALFCAFDTNEAIVVTLASTFTNYPHPNFNKLQDCFID